MQREPRSQIPISWCKPVRPTGFDHRCQVARTAACSEIEHTRSLNRFAIDSSFELNVEHRRSQSHYQGVRRRVPVRESLFVWRLVSKDKVASSNRLQRKF